MGGKYAIKLRSSDVTNKLIMDLGYVKVREIFCSVNITSMPAWILI